MPSQRARIFLVTLLLFLPAIGFMWWRYPDSPHTVEATVAGVVAIAFSAAYALFGFWPTIATLVVLILIAVFAF